MPVELKGPGRSWYLVALGLVIASAAIAASFAIAINAPVFPADTTPAAFPWRTESMASCMLEPFP